MDDLNQKLDALLSSPDGMAKIQSAMAAFGLGGETAAKPGTSPAAQPVTAQPAATQSAVTQPAATQPAAAQAESGGFGGLPDLSMLAKFAPLLGGLGQDDESTALLSALRPYLHGEREKRLDDSIKLMKLQKLLPLLQNKDLLG